MPQSDDANLEDSIQEVVDDPPASDEVTLTETPRDSDQTVRLQDADTGAGPDDATIASGLGQSDRDVGDATMILPADVDATPGDEQNDDYAATMMVPADANPVAIGNVAPEFPDEPTVMEDRTGATAPSSLTNVSRNSESTDSDTNDNLTRVDTGGSHVGSDSPDAEPTLASQPGTDSSLPTASTEPSMHRYRFVEEVARGGMGRIMRAVDPQLHREVACKLLLDGVRIGTVMRERFITEAQVTGQLEHPGIVPVHELGKDAAGNPFYTMKFIRGTSLKQVIREFHALPMDSSNRRLLFVRLLRRFVDVCNTMAFAHQRGVLHRDLKPDNVMLGDFGETLVVDWGLAKVVGPRLMGDDADGESPHLTPLHTLFGQQEGTQSLSAQLPSREESWGPESTAPGTRGGVSHGSVQTDTRSKGTDTMAGEIMGTLKYMSPEQSEGRHDELDARADVYSLGAILYDILTGKRTIQSHSKLPHMLKDVREGNIKPPREVAPWVPRALEAVCMTALATKPDDRYTTALILSADVEAWLADEPVSVYAEPLMVRVRRWARTRRSLVTGVAAAAAVLILGSIVWFQLQAQQLAQAETDARQAIASAETAAAEGRTDDARNLLQRAETIARTQPQLVDLAATVSGRQQYVDQVAAAAEAKRVQVKRAEATANLAEAQSLFASKELDNARDVLTRVQTRLADEPDLKAVAEQVAELSRKVESALSSRNAQIAADEKWQQFQELADLARQHASLFTGERIADDIRTARQHAEEAVALYALDQPWQPAGLSPEAQREIRTTGFELLLLLAEVELVEVSLATPPATASQPDTEPQPSTDPPTDNRTASAETALKWLETADGLGFQTRTLELRRAECLDRLGRFNARDVALAAAEQLQPATRLDYFLLGEYERKAGRLPNAVAAYRQALRQDPDDFWSMHFLGICLYQQGEAAGAVGHLTACVAARPEFVWTYLARAVAFAELNDFDAAYADLAKAEELEPDLYAIGVNRGGLLLRQERLQEAVEQFEHSAPQDDSRPEPWLNLGEARRRMAVAAEKRGEPQDETLKIYRAAAAALEQASRRGGGPRVHRVLGDVHRRTGSPDLALQQFGLAASQERDPKLQAADIRQAGSIFFDAGQFEEALKQYTAAVKLDPDNGDLQRLLAEALMKLGRFEDAVEPFTRALQLSGPNAGAYRSRGLAAAALGRYRNAVNDYTRSLELEADAPRILTRRGWAYINFGTELAILDFERAIELNSEDSDGFLGLGYAQALAGKVEDAVTNARRGVQKAEPQLAALGPRGWPLLFNAASVFSQASGQSSGAKSNEYTAEAIALLKRAIAIAGPDYADTARRNIETDAALAPIRSAPEFKAAFPQ